MQLLSSRSLTMLLFPERHFRAPTQYNSASPDVDTSSLVTTVRKHSGESTESSDNNISIGDTQNGTIIIPCQTSPSATRAVFTNDGVSLEEDVVAFTAANLEDQFTDVEQVVSTDSQLQRKAF